MRGLNDWQRRAVIQQKIFLTVFESSLFRVNKNNLQQVYVCKCHFQKDSYNEIHSNYVHINDNLKKETSRNSPRTVCNATDGRGNSGLDGIQTNVIEISIRNPCLLGRPSVCVFLKSDSWIRLDFLCEPDHSRLAS